MEWNVIGIRRTHTLAFDRALLSILWHRNEEISPKKNFLTLYDWRWWWNCFILRSFAVTQLRVKWPAVFDWSAGAQANQPRERAESSGAFLRGAFKNNKQSWWRARDFCVWHRELSFWAMKTEEKRRFLRNVNSRRLCERRRRRRRKKTWARVCVCAWLEILEQQAAHFIRASSARSALEWLIRNLCHGLAKKLWRKTEPRHLAMMMHSFIHHRCSKFTSHTTTPRDGAGDERIPRRWSISR